MHAASRSLASYFDDTSGGVSGSTTDWHDQMELAGSSSVGKTLGKWMFVPGESDLVWAPHDATDYLEKPTDKSFHKKGQAEWANNAWGKDEYIAIQNAANTPAQPKKARTPRTPLPTDTAERKEVIRQAREKRQHEQSIIHKKRVDALDIIHSQTMNTFLSCDAWDLRDQHGTKITFIHHIITDIIELQGALKSHKNEILKELGKEGTSKEREIALRNQVTRQIVKEAWTQRNGYFDQIDMLCTRNDFFNTLGKTLPQNNPNGSYYLTVAIMFLAKAKEVIMSATLRGLVKKAKEGLADNNECTFINQSHEALTIVRKIKGKDSYPKQPKPIFADTPAILAWTKHVRALEIELFRKRHGDKELPKRLHDKAPPQVKGQGKKGKEGKGHGGGGAGSFEEFTKMYKAWEHMQKTQHHQPVHHSSQPPKGNPSVPSGVPPPPRPGGRRPNMTPPPPPRGAKSYMQGYTYCCD